MLVDSVAVGFDKDDLARSESVSEKKLEIEEGGEQKGKDLLLRRSASGGSHG